MQQTNGPWDNSDLAASIKPSKITKNILNKYEDTISKEALKIR